MTIYIFYHPDTDGITAAATVRYAARDLWPGARFEYVRHGYLTEDKRLQTLIPDDNTRIFAVDISFCPATILRLQRLFGERFVWIDHHVSAIERWAATGHEEPAGIRDVSHSAAWLTWYYFFERQAPLAIELADKYDLWQRDDTWETQTYPWQLVVSNRFGDPRHYDLRVLDDNALLHGYIRHYGEPMLAYERQLRRREAPYVQRVGLRATDNIYKLLFINSSLRDSQTLAAWHRRHPEIEADGYLVGQFVPPMRWKLSLYTAPGSALDVAQIAVRFGGGGHRTAAGFALSSIEFNKHITRL